MGWFRFYPHFFILAALAIALFSISASIYTYVRGPGLGVEGNLLDPAPAYTVNKLMFPMLVNSTTGLVRIPIEGKVNIIVPQYTRCPDICHLETIVMISVMRILEEKGYKGDVVWVTVDVDPWGSTLGDARSYMEVKAPDLARGNKWVWILDNMEVMEKLWGQLGIRAERDPRTGLVAHTAGFIIVDGDGYIRYHVNPRDWSKLDVIASKVIALVEKIARK